MKAVVRFALAVCLPVFLAGVIFGVYLHSKWMEGTREFYRPAIHQDVIKGGVPSPEIREDINPQDALKERVVKDLLTLRGGFVDLARAEGAGEKAMLRSKLSEVQRRLKRAIPLIEDPDFKEKAEQSFAYWSKQVQGVW
jgi:hypothetical protein